MQRVLIVEDDPDLRSGLDLRLSREGYQTASVGCGDRALETARSLRPDLILLDWMLPGMNGLDVCRRLRREGFDMPIIMLTARTDEVDRVVGLEVGADDYVVKPFSQRELLARIAAFLRRYSPGADVLSGFRFGDVDVDFEKRRVMRGAAPVRMTAKEIDLLFLLIRRRGQVVNREELLNRVWGYESYPSTRTVDQHILMLRQKLEVQPGTPQHIVSVHGEGYKFLP